jgi:hypothetical protein
MKVNGAIAELVDSGLFTIATNSWLSGDLAQIAATEGINVKTYYVLKRTPAWAKRRLHLRGLRSNQREVIARFIEAVAEGVENGQIGKGKPASIYIKKRFKGNTVGRTPRPKRTSDELRQLANEIRRMRMARAPAVAAAAAAARRGVEREVE